MQKDNTTLARKISLRISLRKRFAATPVILETHGGFGEIFKRVYADVSIGAVLETDLEKCETLARQRPTWSVYQARAEWAIGEGAAAHLPVTLLDVDPYGEPWPVLEAFFSSERERTDFLAVVVNDGLRQKIGLTGGWDVQSMRRAVERWGNAGVNEHYLEVCRWKLEQVAARQRYRITHWTGYHCGDKDDMTHYAAVLERPRARAITGKPRRPKSSRRAARVNGAGANG
jgi:hypothetical protein